VPVLQAGIKTDPISIIAFDEVDTGLLMLQVLKTAKGILQVIAELGWLAPISIFEFRLSEIPSILSL
jgi:hypothetical protein